MIVAILLVAGVIHGVPDARMAQGDSAFLQQHYVQAREWYCGELRSDPRNAAVLWRLARLENVAAGSLSGEEKHAGYREAEQYARQCVAADSTLAEGHTWLAVSLGNLAMFGGSKEKVRLAHEIKQELDKALFLNQNDDVAYSILGSFYRALGNVSWIERQLAAMFLGSLPSGGYPEAEQALKRAISLAPGVLRHRYELGLLYVDWGMDEQARLTLEDCLRLPPLLVSDKADQERIRQKLAELK